MINAKRLCDIVDAYRNASVVVFGDLILDEYVWGSVDRVSPEAPVVVVEVQSESVRLGGAANVAHNVSSLGGKSYLCAVVGKDSAGQLVTDLLKEKNILTQGIVVDSSRPTTRKTRIVAHSQQVVRVDRETTDDISSTILDQLNQSLLSILKDSRALVVSDYGKGVVTDALAHFIQANTLEPNQFGRKFPVIVDPKGVNYQKYYGASCIKPNKKEASLVSKMKIKNRADAIKVAEQIMKSGGHDQVMITLGADGLVLVQEGEEAFELETIAQEVYDVSGAGDTVSAVYALSLAVGATPIEAATIANCAAARVIREVGTASLDAEELKEVIKFWESSEG